MIKTFRDRTTEAVFNGESPKGLPADLVKVARRKLRYLHAADLLVDLRAPPGNRLEALRAIARDNTPSGSMTNSRCASFGRHKVRQRSRSWIITEKEYSNGQKA